MNRILFKALTVLITIFYINASWAEDPHANHRANERSPSIGIQLNNGKLWATDAPLRQGMERVRAAAFLAEKSLLNGTLEETQVIALAADIDSALAFMFEHCKLEPEADANLHILLERLMHATAMLKKDTHTTEGLPQILDVLESYPQYFNHPEWSTVIQKFPIAEPAAE
ncbi:MAG TPA: hypothetical protein VHP34_02925 [Alphaproteobacteria bacterium]|nr:hypothetical protein [Alphaproteobacteria bacterium]